MGAVSTELVIIFLLLLANGVFAMSEIALVSARKPWLKRQAEKGSRRARAALELAEQPTRFLSTVQIGITLIGTLAAVVGGATLSERLGQLYFQIPWVRPLSETLGLSVENLSEKLGIGTVVVGITFCSVLIGELVPKRIGMAMPERISLLMARPMRLISRIGSPIVHLLSGLTEGILKLFGISQPKDAPVSNEEVSLLIEQGLDTGVFHEAEKEMVEGVLGLDQMPVTALMTPRPKIVWLNLEDVEETNWRKIVSSGHSYFPVYQGNRDHVVGMLSVKALWAQSAIGLQTELKNLLVPPLIVPETLTAIHLLEQFKKTGKHVALVADEFGGIQGLVTLIDVLEAIVGDLPSQGRRHQPQVKQREDGSWLVDATLGVDEIKRILSVDLLPGEAEAGYQSLGGMIMAQLGRIPAAGDYFDWGAWRFEVMDMDRHRVDKVLISPKTPPAPAAAAEAV